jgi:hypothetical protein
VTLGERDVDLTLEKDRIDVRRARGRFQGIRLYAERNAIEISKVQITYSNGQVHNEERRINLLPGERTRPIDLRSEERFIDHIDLFYRTNPNATGNRRHAVIRVVGFQTAAGAAAARPPVGSPSAPPTTTVPTQPTTPAPTQAAVGDETRNGIFLGRQTVGFGADRDIVRVGARIGKFDKVRLRVLDNDIRLVQMRVIYESGEPDTLAYDADIRANSRTKWFALKGDRFIREVELIYRRREGFRGQATVEVYGEYAEGWLAPGGEGSKIREGGWVLLGSATAALKIGFDRDKIEIGRNQGGFRQVRLDVSERAITLREVEVVYESGDVEKFEVPSSVRRIAAGASYGPIDLRGTARRAIREVNLVYRSRFIDRDARGRDAGIVQLWGRH